MNLKNSSLIFLILLIAGCEDGTVDPVNLTFEIQPLRTGNTYFYTDSTNLDENWKIDSTWITVSGKTTVTGEPNSQGVAMWDVYTNGVFVRRNLINLEQDGLYHYAEINNDDTLFIRKLWAKYPVQVGEQFLDPRYTYMPDSGAYRFDGNWKWHCTSIDSQIRIQNGTSLICHIYRAVPETGTEVYLAYALNVGYIGWQVNQEGEMKYRQILTNYTLN
jgi:hypothetical protein